MAAVRKLKIRLKKNCNKFQIVHKLPYLYYFVVGKKFKLEYVDFLIYLKIKKKLSEFEMK